MDRNSTVARAVKIGSVPYLNAKVLVHGLEARGPGFTLEYHTPSVLAGKLRAGQVDLAFLSSIEFFREKDYLILPELSVSGQERMWSIQLFYRGELKALKRIALDPASETTNALLRIVLWERLGLAPEYVAQASGADSGLDGFLKIGDPALAFHDDAYRALDLLSLWHELTGLPFVFAVWLVRRDRPLHGIEKMLRMAKKRGLRKAAEIARAHHAEAGLSEERAFEYVTKIVRYGLGRPERAGLEHFGRYLVKLGMLSAARPLEFYEP